MTEIIADLFVDSCTGDVGACRPLLLLLAGLLIKRSRSTIMISQIRSLWTFHASCLSDGNCVLDDCFITDTFETLGYETTTRSTIREYAAKNLAILLCSGSDFLTTDSQLLQSLTNNLVSACSHGDFIDDVWQCFCRLLVLSDTVVAGPSIDFVTASFEKLSKFGISKETPVIMKGVYFYSQRTNILDQIKYQKLSDLFNNHLFPVLNQCLLIIRRMQPSNPDMLIFETALAAISPVMLMYESHGDRIREYFSGNSNQAERIVRHFKALNEILVRHNEPGAFLEGALTVNSYLAYVTGQLLLTWNAERINAVLDEPNKTIVNSLNCFIAAAHGDTDKQTTCAFEKLIATLQ